MNQVKKRRIPVSLPQDLEKAIKLFSEKNQISQSASIVLFLRHGLEMAEDEYFGTLADELDETTTSFEEHNVFWKKVLKK